MRVGVTTLATAEGDALKRADFFAGGRDVAFLAGDSLVQAGELEARRGVLEAGGGRPSVLRVAVCAIGADLATVLVLVAREAFLTQTEERPV